MMTSVLLMIKGKTLSRSTRAAVVEVVTHTTTMCFRKCLTKAVEEATVMEDSILVDFASKNSTTEVFEKL
eukprot:m.118265 g.118265  ORF g.118265 m.118265 type:complete len:70 (+) comp28647_c0_seq1:1416-1625(+)